MKTVWLRNLDACDDALDWVRNQKGTPIEVWQRCKRGDWMMWLLRQPDMVDRKTLVLCACACARTALQYVIEGEDRPRIAIETAEAWTRGEAAISDVRAAAAAAYAAAAYAAYAAAAYAAYAAAYAAAARAAYADARTESAAAIRTILPEPPPAALSLLMGKVA